MKDYRTGAGRKILNESIILHIAKRRNKLAGGKI